MNPAPALPQATAGLRVCLTANCVARKLPEAPSLQLDGGCVLPTPQPVQVTLQCLVQAAHAVPEGCRPGWTCLQDEAVLPRGDWPDKNVFQLLVILL